MAESRFYFTAENRIDFRELVKDLAAQYKTRIEMRQVGVRDRARKIGGFGICGEELCCSRFLQKFGTDHHPHGKRTKSGFKPDQNFRAMRTSYVLSFL